MNKVRSVSMIVENVEACNNGYWWIGRLDRTYNSVIAKAVARGLVVDSKLPNAFGNMERVLMLPSVAKRFGKV